jgi:protein-disulfide isomerase
MLKISKIALIIMVLASVLLAAGCGGGASTSAPATTPAATSTPSGAKVRIIIYSDLQCPTCHTLYSQIEPKIVEQYVATGKATLETRYVSTKGPVSSLAAQAILCAGDQGQAAKYRDSILAAWARDAADAYTQDRLESAAGALGLDVPAFHSCLTGGKHLQQVSDTTVEAGKAGVSTLPTMFINDVKIEGAKPWVIVSQAIDEQLAR